MEEQHGDSLKLQPQIRTRKGKYKLTAFLTVLLNILIALYNSAYEDITGNAVDEYMALFAHKALQFVRAPDENVFIPREYHISIPYFPVMVLSYCTSVSIYHLFNLFCDKLLQTLHHSSAI